MALAERGAAEAAQRIADALEAQGYRYAIGGALALAIAGVPRGTADLLFAAVGLIASHPELGVLVALVLAASGLAVFLVRFVRAGR